MASKKISAEKSGEKSKKFDVFDEEFFANLQIVKNLLSRIRLESDRKIIKKWIVKLINLESSDVVVKQNRNSFFKYMLHILQKSVQYDPVCHDGFPAFQQSLGSSFGGAQPLDFTCRWSQDRRTYVAAKPLPGRGALVYMAVSKDPRLGWDHN